ncbi:MAG TPA: M1 family aminopeptidase [Terriglobales bacterium]|nr:M1 family aminopeptidase [Terriglobales bacterium]
MNDDDAHETTDEPQQTPPVQIATPEQPATPPRLPVAETAPGWAGQIYSELQNSGLDPSRVYRIRDAAIDREDLHVNFEDGLIAFTKAVDGRITGAFFEGHGEVLLIPPDRVERWSLGQFTGSAILEEPFTTAFFRFNDDTAIDLEPWLRAVQPDESQPFLDRWSSSALTLAKNGNLRLLATFVNSARKDASGKITYVRDPDDRVFFARLGGERVGVFDAYYDTEQPEQILVAHLAQVNNAWYYDVWTSFPSRSARNAAVASRKTRSATIATQAGAEAFAPDPVRIAKYTLRIGVSPPRTLDGEAILNVNVTEPGHRFLRFELSRFLKVSKVMLNGEPVEFIQNQALQGSELERRGNDVIGIVLPQALTPGRQVQLHFTYAGDVLAEAGGGLMYVGARGIWYPNRGLAMSDFDMEFRYPPDYTLLATGKRDGEVRTVRNTSPVPLQVARWISERPIPLAGFNLGKYVKASAKAGNVTVESYAGYGMESTFRRRQTVLVLPGVRPGSDRRETVVVPDNPSPASNAQVVADNAARTVEFLSRRLGPYPYSSLALTQMPGSVSQGWPGLIYLSSYVFLSPDERADLRLTSFGGLMFGHLMQPHEIGHQWLGDLLIWRSYREQWLVEALSNYCALVMLEGENPAYMRQVLDHYRQELLAKNLAGSEVGQAGPVTLGVRLDSSRNPDAYDTISYGRGTWLFHMLREMLLNPGPTKTAAATAAEVKRGSPEEPFFTVLRKVRQRFEGKEITTRDLQQAFEEELPPSLWYEGRKSLDWFFDTWVNGVAIPKFELTDVKLSDRTGSVVATGKIAQRNAPDSLVTAVPVYAALQSGNVLLGRVFVEGTETPFRFTVPRGTRKILLDPYGTVLTRP